MTEPALALGLAALLASGAGAVRSRPSLRLGVVAQADGGAAVCLRFVGPWAPQRASRLRSDLKTAFRRRSVSLDCGIQRTNGADTPPSYQLSLVVDAEVMREVTLTVSDTADIAGRSARRIERYVDLRQVPADGRNLAVVVAADELLDATRRGLPSRPSGGAPPAAAAAPRPPVAVAAPTAARRASPDEPTTRIVGEGRSPAQAERSPPPPVPAQSEPERAAAAPPPRTPVRQASSTRRAASAVTMAVPRPPGTARHAVAMSFAVERYAGGQTHLGPELAWSYGGDRGVFAVLAVGARNGLVVEAVGGVVESSLWSGRFALGAGLPLLGGGLVVAVEAGARLGQLRLQGRATTGGVTPRDADTWLCYTDASASLRVRIAGPVQARVEAGVGLPLLAQRALEGDQTITAASGVAAQGQLGAMVVF